MKLSLTVAGLVLAPFLLIACGDDDPASTAADTPSDSASYPVTVGTGKNAVEIESQPEKIVSLSPTATEMLFAIGAGDQVVAADQYSNYPKDAPTTDHLRPTRSASSRPTPAPIGPPSAITVVHSSDEAIDWPCLTKKVGSQVTNP